MSIGFVLLTHHQPQQIDRLLAQLNKMFNYPPIVCHHDFDKCPLSVDHLSKNIEFVRPQQLPSKMLPHASVFVSRDIYEQLGLFDLNFRIASDFDFLCRCYSNQVSFELIDNVLTTVLIIIELKCWIFICKSG